MSKYGFNPKEETKLKLLAALKDSDKALSPTDWAKKAGVNKVTIYRYIDLIKSEGWLKEKPGPGRSMLYSIKPNRTVLPVDKITATKSSDLKISKKDLPPFLFYMLGVAAEKPQATKTMHVSPLLFKIVANLYKQISYAMSGEMANKEVLDQCYDKTYEIKQQLEATLKTVNGMLLTPELWDPRLVNGFLAGNFDVQQVAQWATDAEANADTMIDLLRSVQDESLWALLDKESSSDLDL